MTATESISAEAESMRSESIAAKAKLSWDRVSFVIEEVETKIPSAEKADRCTCILKFEGTRLPRGPLSLMYRSIVVPITTVVVA